jgi:hypothetical protein
MYTPEDGQKDQNIQCNHQGPDFDDMSSFFPWILCDALKYINLRYELLVTEM